MPKEDPLERLDREAREKGNRGGGSLKTTTYVLAGVAVVLAVVLAFIWIQKSALVRDLNAEKQDLTEQIESLQSDYSNLSSDYDNINSQLDSSREEVALLVERIKKTDATNRAKIRQYEKELGTLRTIMRSYIVQIDSLNTLNHKLQADAADARREAAESKAENAALTKKVNNLNNKVATGSVIKARGLSMSGYNASGKVTDRSSRVKRLLASITLIENDLAKKGPVRVYIVVTDPSGNVLTNSGSTEFTSAGQSMMATASREVDYEGAEVDLSIYVNDIPSFSKGVYTVYAYTSSGVLGHAETLLR